MTESLLNDQWLMQLANYNKLLVGFSGGLDSTVLLHCLSNEHTLKDKLCAIHVNHGLSKQADFWQDACQQFCTLHAIPFVTRQIQCARETNLEEEARIARYQVFSSLLAEGACLLLAHHHDDQAETLLLQLFRGAGVDGLAAMMPVKPFAAGMLARPFLQHPRQLLAAYAEQNHLSWIEDESNQNDAFSRNYLRNTIIPLLQVKWPGVNTNLVRSASHCHQAKLNLEALAYHDCTQLKNKSTTLLLADLYKLNDVRLSNVLRLWLKLNEVRMPTAKILKRLIDEVIFAHPAKLPLLQWGNLIVRRYQQTLYLFKKKTFSLPVDIEWRHFPNPLSWGEGAQLRALPAQKGVYVSPGSCVQVRYRQGGELFSWHGQTKQLKKLFQQWHIPPWQRDTIPLIFIDNCLAVVVGFAISDQHTSEAIGYTYQIQYLSMNTEQ